MQLRVRGQTREPEQTYNDAFRAERSRNHFPTIIESTRRPQKLPYLIHGLGLPLEVMIGAVPKPCVVQQGSKKLCKLSLAGPYSIGGKGRRRDMGPGSCRKRRRGLRETPCPQRPWVGNVRCSRPCAGTSTGLPTLSHPAVVETNSLTVLATPVLIIDLRHQHQYYHVISVNLGIIRVRDAVSTAVVLSACTPLLRECAVVKIPRAVLGPSASAGAVTQIHRIPGLSGGE